MLDLAKAESPLAIKRHDKEKQQAFSSSNRNKSQANLRIRLQLELIRKLCQQCKPSLAGRLHSAYSRHAVLETRHVRLSRHSRAYSPGSVSALKVYY